MSLFEHRVELFSNESVGTELDAYRCLKRRPLDAEVDYFAAPWSVLIWRKELTIPRLRLQAGVTVCQHAAFAQIIPACLLVGITTLFTPHVSTGFRLRPSRLLCWLRALPVARRLVQSTLLSVADFRVLPFPHIAVNGCAPADAKDLWYSFVGFDTHPTRRAIFELPARDDATIKQRRKWHFEMPPDVQLQQKSDYQQILARSRFSLCPRGFAPSTIRFWESLRAGAIPVLIADDMMLPIGFDWDSCVLRVAERDVGSVLSVLSKISPAREKAMRIRCLEAYRMFSGDNLVRCIRLSLASRQNLAA